MLRTVYEFFAQFFKENPSGRRLFEHSGLQVQGRALVSMIGMIVKSLDDFNAFSTIILPLGGRHEIYGVNDSDYECFARVLSETISKLHGETDAQQVQQVWYKVMIALSQMMQASQRVCLDSNRMIKVHRRFNTSSWKQCVIKLTLSDMYIYNNIEGTKLRSSIGFNSIKDVATVEDNSYPLPFALVVTYGVSGVEEKAFFAFETEDETNIHFDNLSWRVQAVQRVFKYTDEDDADDSSGNLKQGNIELTIKSDSSYKSNKKAKQNLFQKKKEKRAAQMATTSTEIQK